jgi:hypothetical protein
MSAALPVYRDRPAIVPSPDGRGRVYISVHDAEYLRQKSEWRRKLFEAHPDHGGSDLRFHRTRRQQKAWEQSEADWYAQYRLTPPLVSPRAVIDATVPQRGRKPPTVVQRLLDVLSDGRYHTPDDLRATCKNVTVYVFRLRRRGFDVRLDPSYMTGLGRPAYRLVNGPLVSARS